MKIGIVGGGNMGSAFARGLLKKHITSRTDLLIVETNSAQRARIAQSIGCLIQPHCVDALSTCSPIILSVKPQDMTEACAQLRPFIHTGQLIISVMAGITIQALSAALRGHGEIIRCMPNLPAQIGLGMTVYCAGPGLTPADHDIAKKVLEAIGHVLRVDNEDLINSATAVSGTGPGYIFYFAEQLTLAAIELGFTEEQAKIMVLETMRGTVELWLQSHLQPSALREMVTSKDGTTAAAVQLFNSKKWPEITRAAIKRAYERSVELAKRGM